MFFTSLEKRASATYRSLMLHDWFKVLFKTYTNAGDHYVGLIAAGIAFYFLMAAFPAIGATISIYGLMADPAVIADHIDKAGHVLPGDALKILSDQAHKITEAGHGALSFSLLISIVLTVYSTTQGAKALMTGCNIAYNVHETRNFFKLNATAYILTLFLVVYFLLSLTLVAILPAVVATVPYAPFAMVMSWLRWPLVVVVAVFGLAVFYFFAPNRDHRQWHWISPGAAVATLMWVVLSSLFSFYVSHFGTYNKTYGSLGAVVILLLWFWLTATTILYGAELNASLEEAQGTKPKSPPALDQAPDVPHPTANP